LDESELWFKYVPRVLKSVTKSGCGFFDKKH